MAYNIKDIKKDFKDKGIFYTPSELAELMKKYVDIKYNNVYDPTCGDGSLLAVFDDEIEKYGQEINGTQLDAAKERLNNFTGVCADTLKEPKFLDKKFDLIMANPPFSIRWEPRKDERFIEAPTIPTAGKADYAFLLHIIYLLSETGMAVVLNFPGILYRGNREGKIRKWMIEKNYIDRVVNIPKDTFVDTKIPTALIIVRKNRIPTDIVFEDKTLKKERVVKLDEIKQNDYILSVSNYIQEDVQKMEVNPLELQREARKHTIAHLRNDIIVDRMVCSIEGLDNMEFTNEIRNVLNEFN